MSAVRDANMLGTTYIKAKEKNQRRRAVIEADHQT